MEFGQGGLRHSPAAAEELQDELSGDVKADWHLSATIQFRLKRMKARGIIDKFTVVANPALLGYAVMAIMLVQTDTDKHDDAKLALAKIPEITEVYSILGEYDLLIKVWAGSLTELNTVMNEKIRAVDGIEDLLEMVVVERVKEEMPPV